MVFGRLPSIDIVHWSESMVVDIEVLEQQLEMVYLNYYVRGCNLLQVDILKVFD
jgi:hypothetical protein